MKYIFCMKDGTKFAEFSSGESLNVDSIPHEIRKKVTSCVLDAGKVIGFTANDLDLEKYGMLE